MSTLGAEIVVVEPGKFEIRFPFKTALTQQNGFIHAGVIASVMDSACGYAAMSVYPDDHDILSVEFKVNLLSPIVGEMFAARAVVKRAGKSLIVCTADAFATQGGEEKLVATMLATMMKVSSKQS
jgi:uncharacterized protein (TIGR00369 family)